VVCFKAFPRHLLSSDLGAITGRERHHNRYWRWHHRSVRPNIVGQRICSIS
jgi:hypothetical protein